MSRLLAVWKNYLKKRRNLVDNIDTVPAEKRRRLKNISLVNGKMMILPIDQGLEHGPVDFLDNPECGDPEYQLRLATEVGFSAIALQYGLAQKYWRRNSYKNKIALVLKLNGKTCIPGDDNALSTLCCDVEEAIEMGAEAVGYTLYVGSPRQDEDIKQFALIRKEANKRNIPVIVWSYPRGGVINSDGGKNSLAAVDYAARVALELGADVVKFNMPIFPKNGFSKEGRFDLYNSLKGLSQIDMLRKVVLSAGCVKTLLSGGDMVGDESVLENAKMAMQAQMDGVIFGRNVWQRDYEKAVNISRKIKQIMLAS